MSDTFDEDFDLDYNSYADYEETLTFATQGGGYATMRAGVYVWLSDIPDFMVKDGAKIGDPIPYEWSVVPVHDLNDNEL